MANGESFFIIGNCEGDLTFRQADSPEALSKYLIENHVARFMEDASGWENWNYPDTVLIIRGAIVIPKAKQVATRWEVER